MHALPTPLEELADGRVGVESSQQLDVGGPDLEEDLVDPLVVHALTVDGVDAERLPILEYGGIEVPHGDSDMVDLGQERRLLHSCGQRLRRRRPAAGAGCRRWMRSLASVKW
jgi:hypothetical protein